MATETDLRVHITWDTEPTEEAKNFIRTTVIETLKETFEDATWLKELVQEEARKQLILLLKDPIVG